MEHKNLIPVVEITTSIPKDLKKYEFMWFDEYHRQWITSHIIMADTDERAISMADEYIDESGGFDSKCMLCENGRIVKIY